jgi:lipid-binding SYLF domain-containing protein
MPVIKRVVVATSALLVGASALAAPSKNDAKRLKESTAVLSEIRGAPDGGIPEQIWSNAECVVVIPGLKKAGFIIGGEFGSGVMSCRSAGKWGAPVFIQLAKGSAGLQAGVQAVDLVLVVMNQRGAEKLLGNKVTLGGDAAIAAGPVGRAATAATDAQLSAEILSYSRAKGLFAGIDLSGGTLRPDDSANARAYGPGKKARAIAMDTTAVPLSAEAQTFTEALGRDVRATTGVK